MRYQYVGSALVASLAVTVVASADTPIVEPPVNDLNQAQAQASYDETLQKFNGEGGFVKVVRPDADVALEAATPDADLPDLEQINLVALLKGEPSVAGKKKSDSAKELKKKQKEEIELQFKAFQEKKRKDEATRLAKMLEESKRRASPKYQAKMKEKRCMSMDDDEIRRDAQEREDLEWEAFLRSVAPLPPDSTARPLRKRGEPQRNVSIKKSAGLQKLEEKQRKEREKLQAKENKKNGIKADSTEKPEKSDEMRKLAEKQRKDRIDLREKEEIATEKKNQKTRARVQKEMLKMKEVEVKEREKELKEFDNEWIKAQEEGKKNSAKLKQDLKKQQKKAEKEAKKKSKGKGKDEAQDGPPSVEILTPHDPVPELPAHLDESDRCCGLGGPTDKQITAMEDKELTELADRRKNRHNEGNPRILDNESLERLKTLAYHCEREQLKIERGEEFVAETYPYVRWDRDEHYTRTGLARAYKYPRIKKTNTYPLFYHHNPFTSPWDGNATYVSRPSKLSTSKPTVFWSNWYDYYQTNPLFSKFPKTNELDAEPNTVGKDREAARFAKKRRKEAKKAEKVEEAKKGVSKRDLADFEDAESVAENSGKETTKENSEMESTDVNMTAIKTESREIFIQSMNQVAELAQEDPTLSKLLSDQKEVGEKLESILAALDELSFEQASDYQDLVDEQLEFLEKNQDEILQVTADSNPAVASLLTNAMLAQELAEYADYVSREQELANKSEST